MEKLLRKTGKDIYKLRKTKTISKGQPDVHAFKEKMAFFTTLKSDIPVIEDNKEDVKTSSKSEEKLTQSSETIDTVTEEEQTNVERFTYEIDPDIGVIV